MEKGWVSGGEYHSIRLSFIFTVYYFPNRMSIFFTNSFVRWSFIENGCIDVIIRLKEKQNTSIKDFKLGIFENDTARVEML